MQILHALCAGLDVHKKTVVACFIRTLTNGKTEKETRTFGTTTPALLQLLDWLLVRGCTHVAMESTGEYWRPIYNLLEGHLEILLVNAQHIKAVPGRKTDVKDAEWIADLLRHGLLKASFVPPQPQRDLRALTRLRSHFVEERARAINRVAKVLEDANVKLGNVATDLTGVSAREMLVAMIAGESDVDVLAEMARGRMRPKHDELVDALIGRMRGIHRFQLEVLLEHMDFLEGKIEAFDREITAQMAAMTSEPSADPAKPAEPALSESPKLAEPILAESPKPAEFVPADPPKPTETAPTEIGGSSGREETSSDAEPPNGSDSSDRPRVLSYPEAVKVLDPIPGIGVRGAEEILAETGTDMSRFPSERHISSWGGVAPGNRESGGKSYPTKARPGNRALRRALFRAARGAIRTKGSYFGVLYRRVKVRRGENRATLAVAHALLVVIYHVLRDGQPYQELGEHYFDERKKDTVVNHLVNRLDHLGYRVNLEPKPMSAPA